MSKGSPIVTFRIKPALLARLTAYIEKSEDTRQVDGKWDRGAFIVKAIEEKLAKIERCARPKPKKLKPAIAEAE